MAVNDALPTPADLVEKFDIPPHEDWCPGEVHGDCCGKECECLGRYYQAVLRLLAACDDADQQDPPWLPGCAGLTTERIRAILGEALGRGEG